MKRLSLPLIAVVALTFPPPNAPLPAQTSPLAPAHGEVRCGSLAVRFAPRRGLAIDYLNYPLLRAGDLILRDRASRQVFFRLSAAQLEVSALAEPRARLSLTARERPGGDGAVEGANVTCEICLPDSDTIEITVTASQSSRANAFIEHTFGGLAANPIKGAHYRLLTSSRPFGPSVAKEGIIPLAPGIFSPLKTRFNEQFRDMTMRTLLGDLRLGVRGDVTALSMRDERYNGYTTEAPFFTLETRHVPLPRGRTARYLITLAFTPQTQRLVRRLATAVTDGHANGNAVIPVDDARIPVEDEVLIIPRPQSYEPSLDDLNLNAQTKIVVTSADEARRTEIVELRKELRQLWGLDLAVVALDNTKDLTNCLIIGEPSAHARMKELCAQENADPSALSSPEGYTLVVRPTYALLAGADKRGTFYAAMTLLQMLKTESSGAVAVQGGVIRDWPDLAFRGVHLHADNYTLEWATWLIERVLSRHKINYIVLECEYARWDSCPDIAPPWAMTREHMRKLKAKAAEYGIEIVPMIRLLGHCEWMFSNGKNLELAEDPVSRYTYCPSEPKSYEFIEKILNEAIDLFQPRLLHVGHDELGNRGTFPSDARCAGQPAAKLFVDDVLRLRRLLATRNVQMMMWGDMLLRPDEARDATNGGPPLRIADCRLAIPREVVVADWHYSPARDYPSLQLFRNLGHPVVAAAWHNRANIFYLAQAARQASALGLLQTTWTGHNGNRSALAKAPQQIAAYILAAEYSWSPGNPPLEFLNYNQVEVLYEDLFPSPALRERQPGFLVDLSRWVNVSLANQEPEGGWLGYGRTFDLRRMLKGRQRLGNTLCLVPESEVWAAGVMLEGALTQRDQFPDSVEIPLNTRAAQLQFVHTCAFAVADGTRIGEYEIKYADGMKQTVPLVYGETLHAWSDPYSGMSRHAVWKGATLSGAAVAVKQLTWDNPRPAVAIASVHLRTEQTDASPVLISLTGINPR